MQLDERGTSEEQKKVFTVLRGAFKLRIIYQRINYTILCKIDGKHLASLANIAENISIRLLASIRYLVFIKRNLSTFKRENLQQKHN